MPDPAAAEAAVRARADAMADKLEARAQQEIGGLPFTSCVDHLTEPRVDPDLCHRCTRDHGPCGSCSMVSCARDDASAILCAAGSLAQLSDSALFNLWHEGIVERCLHYDVVLSKIQPCMRMLIVAVAASRRAVAQAALDQRNTRYRSPSLRSMTEGDDGDDGAIWDRQRNAAMERLEQAGLWIMGQA